MTPDGSEHGSFVSDEEEEFLNEEDILEVIELDENDEGGGQDDEDMEGLDEDEFEPPREDAVAVYQGHDADKGVFSLASHGSVMVSGGEDDIACVWDRESGEMKEKLLGHTDSVVACSFSRDGKYLLTADLAGVIQVWGLQPNEAAEKVCSLEGPELEWVRWHPAAHVILAGCGDGTTWLWLVPSGICKTFAGRSPAATSVGDFVGDGRRAVVGHADGTLTALDLKLGVALHGTQTKATALTSLAASKTGGDIVAAGNNCGDVILYNSATNSCVSTICLLTSDDVEPEGCSVEGLAWCDESLLLAGTCWGDVVLMDTAASIIRQRVNLRDCAVTGITALSSAPVALITDSMGAARLFDRRSLELKRTFYGHRGAIYASSFSEDERWLATASNDATVRLFDLTIPEPEMEEED